MSSKQVVGYDVTISCDVAGNDHNVIGDVMRQWFKKFCFQREKGSSGYEHFQCRGHLYEKKTIGAMIKISKLHLWGGHVSVTCTKVHEGTNFNYVMKADSRVDGPWTDENFIEPLPLTRQLKSFQQTQFRKWQKIILEWCAMADDRSIKLIFDQHGNSGKSIMSEYLEYKGLAFEMPPFKLMEDIMQCAMGISAQKVYLIDMPRAMKKDKLGEFYAGLEALKNGVCYDKRYSFKKRRMDRPQVIVFTNVLPDFSMLSRDRWEVFRMTSDFDLEPYEFSPDSRGGAGATL